MAQRQKDHKAKNILFIAHRGLTTKHLENTLEALSCAFAHQADGVEFDVQLSKDLVPMVFHDRELLRLTNINNLIDNLSYEELKNLRQRSNKYSKDYAIPTLSEVLAAMPAHKIINIELKETTLIFGHEGMKSVLNAIAPYKNKLTIIISSFEPEILRMVNKLDKDYSLGFLIDDRETLQAYFNKHISFPRLDYIHPHISLISADTSKILAKQKIKLILWGHTRMGEESYFMSDNHCALISDIPEELIKFYN